MKLRVVRTCPRCRRRLYHWVEDRIKNSKVRIVCTDCGHRWEGRLTKEEDDK